MLKDRDLREKAILDANINRVSEGLRVIEDWSRFYLRDEYLVSGLRQIRHQLWKSVSDSYPDIVKGRTTGEDILAGASEGVRKCAGDIPKASFNRVKEGLRVLEEMGKVISSDASAVFKEMRFRLYDLEQIYYEKTN